MKYLVIIISIFFLQSCSNENWESLRTKTEEALNKKDYQTALEYLNTALSRDPQSAEIHYYLGQTYRLMLFADGFFINNVNMPYAFKSSEQFRIATEISPRYTGKKFVVDPYTKIQAIWGSAAMTYLYRNKPDSAKWAFNYGQKEGGFYPSMLEYNKNIMASCEENAVILTNGDNDTFPMWYLQLVENYRRDITVVNLSLLNVSWYIKQLKNSYPFGFNNLFMNLTDTEIDSLRPIYWQEKMVEIPVMGDPLNIDGKIKWQMKPTYEDKAIRVQDSMIIEILKSNNWNRPVYFSTTVYEGNRIGLDKYLTFEGLVYKLNPHEEKFNPDKLYKNLAEVYTYQGLNDSHLRNVEEVLELFQNYRYSYLKLISYYSDAGNKNKAAELLEFMDKVLPEKLVPYTQNELKTECENIRQKLS
jgi:tetratricopeptide (TPR) repeat protein